MRRKTLFTLPAALLALACTAEIDGEKVNNEKQEDVANIIGGITDPDHGYVVGVGSASGAFCTGTLISAQPVISAGHCFTPGQTNGGVTRVFTGINANTPLTVATAIRHPNYNDNTLANDLMIIKLASPVTNIAPAPLLRENMNNTARFIGPALTFAGFGVNNGVNQTGFGTRRVVTFPIQAVGPATVGGTPGSIDATQFYFKVPGENTCNGDSGGPAFFIADGIERHAGVTSFGDGPCTLDGVQQITDSDQIASFIQPNINTFEPNNPNKNDGVCNAAGQAGSNLLKDPDCALQFSGADGVCVPTKVKPNVDPDCAALGINPTRQCDENGICETGCAGEIDTACEATPPPPTPVCGNGTREGTEQCDDGNLSNGDGCDSLCRTEVPSQGTFTGSAAGLPAAIPDNNATGITSTISVPAGIVANTVVADINISHTFRGDLIVRLTAPNGQVGNISVNAGGSADNIVGSFDLTSSFSAGLNAAGTWRLSVVDNASADVGTLNSFTLKLNGGATPPPSNIFVGQNTTAVAIPDNNTTGVTSTINATGVATVNTVQVELNITHTFRGDLTVTLTNPANVTKTVIAPTSSDSADNIVGKFSVAGFTGSGNGSWKLKVTDKAGQDVGTLVSWKLGLNTTL
jgi:cysteine-rich repeat protein